METIFQIKLGEYVALVDMEDKSKVVDYRWKLLITKSNFMVCYTSFYDKNKGKRKCLWLHQVIKPKPEDCMRAIFLDGNRLNCTKNNIEYISSNAFGHVTAKRRKSMNSKLEANFRGVAQVFRSRIKYNNKTYHLGTFNDPKDAAKAYNQKALQFFGPEAKLNVI